MLDLLAQCRKRQARGESFEQIWRDLLRDHPAAIGSVVTPAYGDGNVRIVPLQRGALHHDLCTGEWAFYPPILG